MFDDLNKSNDWKKNEWILSQFFQAKDPAHRREINVFAEDKQSQENSKNMKSFPVEVKGLPS
jgi:hypothetical protein